MLRDIFEITTSARIHWIYLVSSALISLFFIKRFQLFSIKYLWNYSSKLDIQLFITNRILKFFIILPIEASIIFYLSKSWLTLNSSPFINISFNSSINLGLYTLFYFVFNDFLRFLQHYLMHKIPALWEIHKVHHSAHTLNAMTLYRMHPIEALIAGVRRVFSTTALTCLMLSISSQTIGTYQILGVLSFNFIFNIFGGNLRHSHIPFSFGLLDRIFISPAQHQIHHSKNSIHFDKNFGAALSVWDQIFSTWLPGSSKQKIHFGLNYRERNHKNHILSALSSPLKHAFNKLSFTHFLTLYKAVSLTRLRSHRIKSSTGELI